MVGLYKRSGERGRKRRSRRRKKKGRRQREYHLKQKYACGLQLLWCKNRGMIIKKLSIIFYIKWNLVISNLYCFCKNSSTWSEWANGTLLKLLSMNCKSSLVYSDWQAIIKHWYIHICNVLWKIKLQTHFTEKLSPYTSFYVFPTIVSPGGVIRPERLIWKFFICGISCPTA